MWTVYMLRCADGSLYTGSTTDVVRRLAQHNAGKGGAYTRGRGPARLVYREPQPDQSAAFKREAEIKSWTRKRKQRLCAA